MSPTLFCQRAKGRLQHALRVAGTPTEFSRKVSFRSLGENTSEIVAACIRGQVRKAGFADERFARSLNNLTTVDGSVRLAEPSGSRSGRYWYNLHLVLVAAGRFRVTNLESLTKIRDAAFAIATGCGHTIAALSLMPDHLHVALRGNIECSPQEIGLAFQNGLAEAAGCRAWQDGFYVGTFSEYDLGVVRAVVRRSSSPAG